jgi:hypothetical protein
MPIADFGLKYSGRSWRKPMWNSTTSFAGSIRCSRLARHRRRNRVLPPFTGDRTMKRLSAAIAIAAVGLAAPFQPGPASAQSTALITAPCLRSASACQTDWVPGVAGWGALRAGASVPVGITALSSWPPADPISGAVPSNGFFNPADSTQYALDCSGPYFIVNYPATTITQFEGIGAGFVTTTLPAESIPICSVTTAPVVDASAAGY